MGFCSGRLPPYLLAPLPHLHGGGWQVLGPKTAKSGKRYHMCQFRVTAPCGVQILFPLSSPQSSLSLEFVVRAQARISISCTPYSLSPEICLHNSLFCNPQRKDNITPTSKASNLHPSVVAADKPRRPDISIHIKPKHIYTKKPSTQ